MSFVSRRNFLTGSAALGGVALTVKFHNADAQQAKGAGIAPKNEGAIDAIDKIKVPTYDTRGRGPDSGIAASTSASKQGVVVVLVASSDESTIKTAEETLKKVISEGRSSVGMIVGDKYEGTNDAFYLFSKGKVTNHIKNPKSDDITKQILKGAVLRLYIRDVEPLLKESPQPRN